MRNKRMIGKYEPVVSIDANGIQYKRCTFCGEVKPVLEGFAKNGVDSDGATRYRDDCKVCYNVRRKENRNKKRHSDFVGNQKRRGEESPTLTHQEWKECVIFFGGECAYCGCTPRRGRGLTRDHLRPIAAGGATTQANIVPACDSCNSSKGSEDFKVWFMKQPFFSQERLNKIFKWRTMMQIITPTEVEVLDE